MNIEKDWSGWSPFMNKICILSTEGVPKRLWNLVCKQVYVEIVSHPRHPLVYTVLQERQLHEHYIQMHLQKSLKTLNTLNLLIYIKKMYKTWYKKIIYKDQLRNIRRLLFHFLKVRMFWFKNTNTNPNHYTNKKINPSWKLFEKFRCSWSTYSPDCSKLDHLTVFSVLGQNFKSSSFPTKLFPERRMLLRPMTKLQSQKNKENQRAMFLYLKDYFLSRVVSFSIVVVAIPDFCLDNSKYFLLVGTKLIRAALQYLFNLVNRSTNIGGKYITHTRTCHYVRISFIETAYPAPSSVCLSP